jgi:hypothetical protein
MVVCHATSRVAAALACAGLACAVTAARIPDVGASVFPAGGPADGAPFSFSDNFTTYKPQLWTQTNNVIMHCNDGACFDALADHLAFTPGGLRVSMNQAPCNESETACCVGGQCVQWAAGHMTSAANLTYGTYTFNAKVGHAPLGGAPPSNAFTCLTSIYVDSPTHNEIAACWNAANSSQWGIAYWVRAAW